MLKSFKKINQLLDHKQKATMVFLVFVMLIGAVLEALGITLVLPIMQAIIDPESILENQYHMGDLYRLCGAESMKQFAVMMMIAIVRPYEYYLNANTAIIQRNITSDINNVYALILNILQMTSEVIVFVILIGVLVVMDPWMTLAIAALLVVVLLVIKKFLKPVMIKAGKEKQDYYSGQYQRIAESVDAVKEIKIANRENYFITEYSKCGNGYVNAVQKYSLYSSTPRLLIEWIFMTGIVLYLLIQVMGGSGDLTALVPQLGAFAVAAARLLPSANRMNTYMTNISYFQPFLDNVSENLQEEIHDKNISYRVEDYDPGDAAKQL